jgi:ABC-type transport system substrate-binding protein
MTGSLEGWRRADLSVACTQPTDPNKKIKAGDGSARLKKGITGRERSGPESKKPKREEDPMNREKSAVSRRDFLKQGAAVGLLIGGRLTGSAWAASKERVTILSSSVTDTLNPYNHSGSLIYGMWQHIFEPLVEVSYNPVRYTGVLAESWEFQGKNWVFRLRKGIRFHDGAPFTAKDVIFSVNRMRTDKNSLQGTNFNDVVEMQAPDDYTVVFVLKRTNALFLDRVENRFIISKAAADKYGDEMDQHGIGTGAYKFVSFQRGGNFVMTRNDDYWGAKAEIKEVIFKKVTEDAARVAALESGQADIINNVPVHDVPRLERSPKARIEKVEGLRMFFLALNPAFKPFDNKLVRQAVNYSVDAPAIVKNIFEGGGFVLNGPVASNVIGYDPNRKRYPYDPQKSRELLARQAIPEVSRSSFIYPPADSPGTEKCVRSSPLRWKRAVLRWNSSHRSGQFSGGPPASTAASCLFTISAEAAWSMPTLSTINIFGRGPRSEWPTAIRSSIG